MAGKPVVLLDPKGPDIQTERINEQVSSHPSPDAGYALSEKAR